MQFINWEQVWRQIIKQYLGLPVLLNQEIFEDFASALLLPSQQYLKVSLQSLLNYLLKKYIYTYIETEHMM